MDWSFPGPESTSKPMNLVNLGGLWWEPEIQEPVCTPKCVRVWFHPYFGDQRRQPPLPPLIQKTESPPTFMFSRITRTLDGSEWLEHSYIRWFCAFLFLEDVKTKIRLTGKSPDFIEDTPSSGCVFSIVILVFGGSNWKPNYKQTCQTWSP